jgi:hypothetical protein
MRWESTFETNKRIVRVNFLRRKSRIKWNQQRSAIVWNKPITLSILQTLVDEATSTCVRPWCYGRHAVGKTKDNLFFNEDIEWEELNPSKGAIVKRNLVPQDLIESIQHPAWSSDIRSCTWPSYQDRLINQMRTPLLHPKVDDVHLCTSEDRVNLSAITKRGGPGSIQHLQKCPASVLQFVNGNNKSRLFHNHNWNVEIRLPILDTILNMLPILGITLNSKREIRYRGEMKWN